MSKPKQTSLEIIPPAPGAHRAARKRLRVASLRKPLLIDFQSFMQMTQGVADAAEAAKQGSLKRS